ncbi:MAG: NAD(P)-dependent oxidoreductase [Gemmatimonadota bacterium]|nr:NAD(P)-dependent oxidoreductase [Gemmatimonadota bacterium]
MTPPRLVAITGASGFLGRALLERLVPRQRVRALFRRHDDVSAAWARRGCEIVVGNLDDADALAYLVRGADVVQHCAATMGKSNARLSHRVNVVGTERLVRAAVDAGVPRFVYVSSISVFAATRRSDGTITEAVEPERVDRLNPYGRTKYQGEVRTRTLTAGTGTRYTILRPTNIYGPGSGPWFHAFERLLRRVPVAIGDLPIDVVYVEDVVDAMILAAGSPAAADGVFHLSHEMVNMNRFILKVAEVTGQRAWRLPRAVDRVLRGTIDRGYRTVTRTHMSMSLVHPAFYPHGHAHATFDYAPRVRLAEGFARLAAWYRPAAPAPTPRPALRPT